MRVKEVVCMLTDEIRNKLYKELETQLDNKQFFNAKDYYSSNPKIEEITTQKVFSSSNIGYANSIKNTENDYDYTNTVKGISFSNKVETTKKTKSINDLSLEDRKIYKITDLLSANLEETIVIPYNIVPESLALVRKFDWKDVLFSDVGTAWGLLKDKLKIK